jgi:hypothetical protein
MVGAGEETRQNSTPHSTVRSKYTAGTFATRLTDIDRSRSLVTAGTRDGFFRVVYCFENEQLVELSIEQHTLGR